MAQTLVTDNGDRHGPYPDDKLVPLTRGEARADSVEAGDYLCVCNRFTVKIASREVS